MSPTVREILGTITLLAIVWDTVVTSLLLRMILVNNNRVTIIENMEKQREQGVKATKVKIEDITSLVQAVCALATAALTTYTLIDLILKRSKQSAIPKSDKSDNPGIRNVGNNPSGGDNPNSDGKS